MRQFTEYPATIVLDFNFEIETYAGINYLKWQVFCKSVVAYIRNKLWMFISRIDPMTRQIERLFWQNTRQKGKKV